MKKRIFALLFAVLFSIQLFPAFAAGPVEAKDINMMLDCRKVVCSQPPIVIAGSTLLPLRSLLVSLGVPNDDKHIIWNQKDKSATIIKGNSKVYLKIGSKKALVNKKAVTLDVAPVLYKNKGTYIPVRFVSQALGMKVAWDASTKTVLIRNEADYKKTGDFLGKLFLSMDKTNGVNMDTALNMVVGDGKSNYTAKAEMSFKLDRVNRIMSTSLNVPLFSDKMNFKSYYTKTARYEYDPSTTKWQKYTSSDTEFSKNAGKNVNPFASISTDLISSGFSLAEGGEPGEMIATGIVFPEVLSQMIYEKIRIGSYTISSCKSQIYIDEASMTIKKITMDIKGKFNGISDITANIEVSYSYPGKDFKIEVPEGLKLN